MPEHDQENLCNNWNVMIYVFSTKDHNFFMMLDSVPPQLTVYRCRIEMDHKRPIHYTLVSLHMKLQCLCILLSHLRK